jgi:hypothetical protein
MRPQTSAIVVAILSLATATTAHAEADHAAIAKASLEQYIRPGYAQLTQSTDALKQSVAALCGKPSPAALKDTQDAFAATVEAWSVVEPIRFGPVAQEHRFERIFYWPDPKGLGTRQIRDALAKQDKSVTEPARLIGKSVALQGLPALEYLLYGDGAATLGKIGAEGTFRCSFAEAVAGNLAGIAKDIVDGWQDGAPYTKSYLEPGPTNAAYHTPKEVTLELFKTFTAGIEWVRDQKLAKTLGPKPEQARPQLAPSGGAGRASPTWPAILPVCATCSPKAGSRKWCISSPPASRTRSCSISITPSRSCAAWTSPWPTRCATRSCAASSKPCASR